MRILFLASATYALIAIAAPSHVPISKYAGPVKANSYIIKLKDDTSKHSHIAHLLSTAPELTITYQYENVFHGYAAELEGQALDFVRRSREVESIFEDGITVLDFA
ncbi:unnamed protein product [Rhizoctonia solani]|nr:unnamed protein product [Rhizoctonia solani]